MHSLLIALAASVVTLSSPDGNIAVTLSQDKEMAISVDYKGTKVLDPSTVSMTLDDGTVMGTGKYKVCSRSVDNTLPAICYKKNQVRDCFNEKTLDFNGCSLVVRAYNSGVAYRWVSRNKKAFKVMSETADFSFPADWTATAPYVRTKNLTLKGQFFNSFENYYTVTSLTRWDSKRLAFLPAMVQSPEGVDIVITDADVRDYPGMYLNNSDGDCSLEGMWAPYPVKDHQGGHNMLQRIVDEYGNYLAAYPARKQAVEFPWRVMAITDKDYELADNDLVYLLATPADKRDWSWVKPGKVAWEWWNDWNIKGVDFESGVNNATYKYYIDFASAHGVEYVILDEGWSVNKAADLMQVVPEIDLVDLVDYAAARNVGIILWAGYYAFERDIEGVCKHYSEMGVKGFKVDFMDSDNQRTMHFLEKSAEIAAKYHLVLDFHGICKPAGLYRTWPNVVNYEGIHGLENMKWEKPNVCKQVVYDVQVPFLRFLAGPADYTQGAMRNATKQNYFPSNSEPMSQGTRCRQLAQYVVFSSPLNMLCDTPVNYMAEPECTDFIAAIPTVWDETRAIGGKVGEYIVMARRSGDTWYVGGMTDWTARDFEIDPAEFGGKVCEMFVDGANAHRIASDYKKVCGCAEGKVKVHMAPGGGFVVVIK